MSNISKIKLSFVPKINLIKGLNYFNDKNEVNIIAPLRDDNYHKDSIEKAQFSIGYALELIFDLKLQKILSCLL